MSRSLNRLNVKAVENAAAGKKHADGGGLYLITKGLRQHPLKIDGPLAKID